MIKTIIFDLDNTLLDFIKMKGPAVQAATSAMVEADLEVDEKGADDEIFRKGKEGWWGNQQIYIGFLNKKMAYKNNKFMAARIVE